MTTDQSARERIDDVLNKYWLSMMNCIATGDMDYHKTDAATEIIAIVTEALNDPAVIAVGDKGCPPPIQVKRVVSNVLDTAFGEEAA